MEYTVQQAVDENTKQAKLEREAKTPFLKRLAQKSYGGVEAKQERAYRIFLARGANRPGPTDSRH